MMFPRKMNSIKKGKTSRILLNSWRNKLKTSRLKSACSSAKVDIYTPWSPPTRRTSPDLDLLCAVKYIVSLKYIDFTHIPFLYSYKLTANHHVNYCQGPPLHLEAGHRQNPRLCVTINLCRFIVEELHPFLFS